ncbi:hypothetical protein SCP_0607570 [Sparassis crispa]|uniref:Uncharacterized protein n=1 Tax=Sparassis crispa TaxID=139825 RepID=A0A401GRC2_9APHY|nr:hypothetical protein SCP_0607570 [Sparassis crispa]GBE84777.1 hypothetical protein SCP_0607570 [Sparassis crispa]
MCAANLVTVYQLPVSYRLVGSYGVTRLPELGGRSWNKHWQGTVEDGAGDAHDDDGTPEVGSAKVELERIKEDECP